MTVADIDITADLTDGSFDAGVSSVPNAQPGQSGESQMFALPGTEPAHGNRTQNPNGDSLAPAPADKTPSVRELLSSAFKAPDGQPTDQQAAQPVQAPAAQAPTLSQDEAGKYRNPDGTYASAEQIAAFTAASTAAPQQAPFLAAFTPAEQEQFKALPAELQQFVGRTMETLDQQRQRYGEYDLMEQMIAPRREAWARGGSNPAAALNQLFAVSDFAGRAPGEFLLWFADQQKLDVDAILDARDAAQAQAGPVNPQVQQLTNTVQQLQQTVQSFTQERTQAVLEHNKDDFTRFALEKDAQGNLQRPYLTDVASTIAQHVQTVRQQYPNLTNAEVLQKAYDNACWTDANVRTKMQKAAAEAQRQSTLSAALRARQAGSSVNGGPAGGESSVPNNSARTLREELRAQFQAHSA